MSREDGPLEGLEWDVYSLRVVLAELAAGLAHGADPVVLLENVLIAVQLDEGKVQDVRDEAAGLGARRAAVAPPKALHSVGVEVVWSPMQHGWVAEHDGEEVIATTWQEAIETVHQLILAATR